MSSSAMQQAKPWKIAFEEHFLLRGVETKLPGRAGIIPDIAEKLRKILEVGEERIAAMDRAGIEFTILSLNAPGIQGEVEPIHAVRLAKTVNDELAALVSKHPKRFGGFAAVPLQEPKAAADELERAVRQLGFKGALVNGYSNLGDENTAEYLDEPKFLPFWERAQDLDVPIYLHPRDPLPTQQRIYHGHPELLAATWAFGVETGTHVLRLITSGLFDRYPRLTVLLGHLGEMVPFTVWRTEKCLSQTQLERPLKKRFSQYVCENFYYTTAAFFSTTALIDVMLEVGSDRICFSIDYPWQSMEEGGAWFDGASISEPDRLKIGRTNAMNLFKLNL